MRVVLTGASSEWETVNLGVPQGTILGPIIFLLFINDLPSFLKDVHIVMYADDTTIALAAETAEDLERLAVDAVNTFTRWCERNRLIVNLEKNCMGTFSPA